ncbi:hypothetical protein ACE198_00920 [Neobacillus sp. KR4-4]|uniref:hypothetical protein n=1 Tax=Neobacillus sp. KR4-4 TaxID=3344872 RepID=UPI0035C9694F
MIEIIKEVLSKFGIPGIIFSIILIIIKLNPITSISASPVELKLFSKEKRFYVKFIRTLSEILFYLVLLWLITDKFFSNKEQYNSKIALFSTILIFAIFIVICALDLFGKTFFNLFGTIKRRYQIVIYMIFLIYGLSWILLPSYYIGTQIYSEFYNDKLTTIQQYSVLVGVLFFYLLLIIFVYFTVIKTLYRFLEFFSNSNKNLTVVLNNKCWYLFHPVDNEQFLLGDKPVMSKCTEFSFIEKSNLFLKTIKVEEIEEN